VEAEPELDGLLLELQACLDDLVAEQQQQYKQYEARLARMSPEERALFYSSNAGDAVYDNVIDDTWQMIKAAPAVLEKAAGAFPGFCKNSLSTLWKIAQTPSRMAYLTAQGIVTGNYNPLQQEIDSIVTPMATTYEQALEYKSMLTILFQDEEIYAMLYDFAERYWDATHPVERTRMTASAASDILVTLILAIFTAGVGAAANVAAKSGKLAKAGKLLKKITETIKRTAGRHQVPKKDLEGGAGTTARTGSGARKGGIPEVESPKDAPKKKPDIDDGGNKGYDAKEKSGGSETAPLHSSGELMGVEKATPELLDAVKSKGRTIDQALPGSDDLRYLDSMPAEAAVGGPEYKNILVRQNPSKAAVLEEFLHGTQHDLGTIDRLGRNGAETHVKDFMIRHKKLLGLGDEDVKVLQQLKDAGL
jgi:hypothetical protein